LLLVDLWLLLLDMAEAQAKTAGVVLDNKARMADRIKAAEAHLPPFFVEHRAIYGVISSGIHEKSESWCLRAFPVAWAGLKLILIQELAKKQAKKLEEETGKRIAALTQEIKTSEPDTLAPSPAPNMGAKS
jgi:hypothetical protein